MALLRLTEINNLIFDLASVDEVELLAAVGRYVDSSLQLSLGKSDTDNIKLLDSLLAFDESLFQRFGTLTDLTDSEVHALEKKNPDRGEKFRVFKKLRSFHSAVDITRTKLRIKQATEKYSSDIISESGIVTSEMRTGAVTTMSEQQNMEDAGGSQVVTQDIGNSEYEETGSMPVTKIDNFMERPLLIAQTSVPYLIPLKVQYPVYAMLSNQPSVRAKFRNFAFFKADLRIRINISGTPFHFGKLIVSWQKYPDINQTYQNLYVLPDANKVNLFNYLSQAPGATTIDVKMNEPLEISVPFVFNRPMMRLFNTTSMAISGLTPLADFEDIGTLHVQTLNPISYTTDVEPPAPNMSIYAWFENVEMGANTASVIEILTESGEYDERESGPIERFATRAMQVSQYLDQVPVIGPYARASNIPLLAMKNIASLFGWSKPTMDSDVYIMKNMPYRNGAQVIGKDSSYRITLDPKQELTVDPRIMGTEHDELSFSCLSQKESFLTTFVWDFSEEPLGRSIWQSLVTPYLYTFSTNVVADTLLVSPTPMAYVAQPFAYWRGDIEFRFEFVVSQFHRGKIAVIYEPNSQQRALMDTNYELNKNYVRVFDLQETQNVSVCVEWNSAWAWQRAPAIDKYKDMYDHEYGTTTDAEDAWSNGLLSLVPFTRLQSPNDSDVQVNVYVKARNLRVNFLNDTNLPNTRVFVSESSDSTMTYGFTTKATGPGLVTTDDVDCVTLNPSTAEVDRLNENYFGECPVSFRSLLKRFATQARVNVVSGITLGVYQLDVPNYPRINKSYTATSNYKNLYDYLRYAYLGIRGGMRHRINVMTPNDSNVLNTTIVTLNQFETTDNYSVTVDTSPPPMRINGSVCFVASSNGGIEYEAPFYNNLLFLFSCNNNLVGPGAAYLAPLSFQRRCRVSIPLNGSDMTVYATDHISTGEDFSFMGFLGTPYFALPSF